jgi:hypothetical protein
MLYVRLWAAGSAPVNLFNHTARSCDNEKEILKNSKRKPPHLYRFLIFHPRSKGFVVAFVIIIIRGVTAVRRIVVHCVYIRFPVAYTFAEKMGTDLKTCKITVLKSSWHL